MKPVILSITLGVSFGLSPLAQGQKASALAFPEKHAEVSGEKEESAPVPVDDTPSRFAGKDIDSYTQAREAVFSMGGRETDPFGLNQDPSVKPPEKSAPTRLPTKRLAALPPTPLSDIVKLIRVTTIMPGDRKFLVGTREFSESDEFPLVFRGKRMRMKVTEVSAARIVFRNLENGETAALETGILPPGMVAGAESIQPEGMASSAEEIPLELGSPNPEFQNN